MKKEMAETPEEGTWPRWAVELNRAFAFHFQFMISGNIRDVYPVTTEDGPALLPILDVISTLVTTRGYQFILVYDPVDGVRVLPRDKARAASQASGLQLSEEGCADVSLQDLPRYIRTLSMNGAAAGVFVIDYASRITTRPQDLSEDHRSFFVACEKLAQQAPHLRSPGRSSAPPFNPVIWLVNRANDVPNWFIVGNETVRSLLAGLPDRGTRRQVAARLAIRMHNHGTLEPKRREGLVDQFALLTEGMTLRSIQSIAQLMFDRSFGLERIADAVRAYKVGTPDDPWKQPMVRASIAEGAERVTLRVKGQQQAVDAALAILTRSVMGLTGAHTNRTGGRPRGVLFFAGPTGVGKTELAKALTELLFGDEGAYHRFDMSEFSAEHSEARLIGAPPGYVGYDSGGELVNAIRQRPFSVLLFDEIEKAHPRILDKFLQILEDGRLTDGRGETVFFSESVIIFTSNLGIIVKGPDGTHHPNVVYGEPYEQVKTKVTKEVVRHFRLDLQRPELLNRIGNNNIVVFDFIQPHVALEIFDKMLENVAHRVAEEHRLILDLSEDAKEAVKRLCLEDLEQGGRGIGSRLETYLINPLARALFPLDLTSRSRLRVDALTERDGNWELNVS